MISCVCLFWVGTQVNAPIWYYVLIVISALLNTFNLGRTFDGKDKDA